MVPGEAKRHPAADPVLDPGSSHELDEGIRLFNEGHHWHAHEAWERLWLGLEGDDKLFVQGLIMSAAMLHQYRRCVVRGVINHWANVEARLPQHGPKKWGIDVAGLMQQLARYAEPVLAGDETMELDPGAVRIHRE